MRSVLALLIPLSGAIVACETAVQGGSGTAAYATVRGTVADVDGQTIADAAVYLTSAITSDGVSDVLPTMTTRTDRAGVWTFQLTRELKIPLVVLVSKSGYALGIGRLNSSPFPGVTGAVSTIRLGETADLPIWLGPPTRLTLQVVNEQGTPVSKARLRLCSVTGSGGARVDVDMG